ncbi:MAG: hypothetical protein ACT4ON_15845 [Bacteroidota bacterium]
MRVLAYISLLLLISTASYSQTGNDSFTKAHLKDTLQSVPYSIIDTSVLNDHKPFKPTISLKQDSLTLKKTISCRKDSLVEKHSDKLKLPGFSNKNAFLKKQLNALKPHGMVSLGYEYGVLPFVAGNNYPSGGYKTEGRISFLLLNLPLELTYYYTSIKNVIGLNNYFRISYDANRYKDQLNQKMDFKDKLAHDQLNTLQLQQQQTLQKITYLNFLNENLLNQYQYQLKNDANLKNNYISSFDSEKIRDSLASLIDTSGFGSISNVPDGNSENPFQPKKDSIKNNNDYLQKKDSISSELKKYQTKYDSINNEINTVKQEIDQIKNLQNNPSTLTNPYLSKVQQFLSHIKKLEIGLCNPTYSTFLVNNIPLQGINVEYSKNNNFLAFTYGTTINNLMYNTNNIEGAVQGIRNLYNYFDFGNLNAGRKILSIKGGLGAKDDSHLYIGVLVGKGRTNYLVPTVDKSSVYAKESNVVMELDGKYKFSEQLNIDIILGKSSVREEDLTMEQVKKALNEILSNYRSYALLTRINLNIKKTNTKLTLTNRWVDPYFKSFGVGFLRSDNLRYEIKAEQPLTKKIKYTVTYRREEDNLLKLYNYKNTLQSINNSLNVKISRQINLRLNYAPLFRTLKTPAMIVKDKNQMATIILSFFPKAKKIDAQFNALYSKYIISGDSAKINFENFTYTHQLQFKSGFKTGGNLSWFKNKMRDSLNNDTYLTVLDVGYTTKNNDSFTIGGKMAYKKAAQMQYGFVVKAAVRLYKGLFWEADAEKIILGDYYNSFLIEQINKFPYYCSTRLILNF